MLVRCNSRPRGQHSAWKTKIHNKPIHSPILSEKYLKTFIVNSVEILVYFVIPRMDVMAGIYIPVDIKLKPLVTECVGAIITVSTHLFITNFCYTLMKRIS